MRTLPPVYGERFFDDGSPRLYNGPRRMADPIYVYSKVIRAGLGNNLVAWARSELFARDHNLPRIAPHWFVFKLGPILRGERDWRWYGSLFHNGDAIGGLRRWRLLKSATITRELEADQLLARRPAEGKPQVIEFNFNFWGGLAEPKNFEQMGRIFSPLVPHADFLRKRLRSVVAPANLKIVDSMFNEPFIGIHFRRGDKPPLAFGTPYPVDTDHPTLPAEWYVEALKSIRERLGFDAPAIVFTDGKEEQTAPLRALPNVLVAPANNAIVDLLLMAKSKIFITTFSSSFSMWSAMLSGAPSVNYPGREFRLVDGRPEMTLFTDLDGKLDPSTAPILQNAFPRAGAV